MFDNHCILLESKKVNIINMLFLKSWLEEYINLTDYTDTEISDFLSLRSGECESVETISEYFGGKVVVGRIENLKKHPEADRLNIFDINIGNGNKVQIVSAAPNARDGLICPVALDGAKLPYITIVPRKMRGVESQGMCCGMSELACETEFSDGLWELNDLITDETLGKSVCEVIPQFFPTQTVFEIKYLQDKLASCANHLGLAVELSKVIQNPELLKGFAKSIFDPNEFKNLVKHKIESLPKSTKKLTFKDDTNQTNFFTVLDLELTNSFNLPHVYQIRLFLTGKNMIGGLADLSNYLLFDVGQPSHYFDTQKTTNLDWTIKKLDSKTNFKGLGQLKNVDLPKELSVMVDGENKILTIPGVSGSEATKTENETKNVLIEIANFPAEMVAITSSEINYRSDASKYWASGVNPALTLVYILKLIDSLPNDAKLSTTLNWASKILQNTVIPNLIGNPLTLDGKTSTETQIKKLQNPTKIEFDMNYISDRLDNRGIYYWKPILEKKLKSIGELNTLERTQYSLTPSIFYNNLKTQEDVLFELAKLVGFDNLEPEFLSFSVDSKTKNYYHEINSLKNIFSSFGFSEVLTRPFLPSNKLLSSFLKTDINALVALSSQRRDEPFLRDSLFSSLLNVINSNIKLGIKEPKIFELTKIYLHSNNQLNDLSNSLDQTKVWENFELAGICCGSDPYLLTSLIIKISDKLKLQTTIEMIEESYNKIGNGITYNLTRKYQLDYESKSLKDKIVSVDKKFPSQLEESVKFIIAQINLIEIKNSIKKTFDLPLNKTFWYLDIKFNPTEIKFDQYTQFSDQSDFPVVERSYSLVVPKELQWTNLKVILRNEKIIDTQIIITAVERISKDNKDVVNFKVDFSSYTRTLTGKEIELWETAVLDKLKIEFGVEPR